MAAYKNPKNKRRYKKKKFKTNFWKVGRKNGPKGEDRSNRIMQKNKRAGRKVESNFSPEVPDSGEWGGGGGETLEMSRGGGETLEMSSHCTIIYLDHSFMHGNHP